MADILDRSSTHSKREKGERAVGDIQGHSQSGQKERENGDHATDELCVHPTVLFEFTCLSSGGASVSAMNRKGMHNPYTGRLCFHCRLSIADLSIHRHPTRRQSRQVAGHTSYVVSLVCGSDVCMQIREGLEGKTGSYAGGRSHV